MGGNFKFQGQNSFLEYFFWRFEKQIALSEKKTPLETLVASRFSFKCLNPVERREGSFEFFNFKTLLLHKEAKPPGQTILVPYMQFSLYGFKVWADACAL